MNSNINSKIQNDDRFFYRYKTFEDGDGVNSDIKLSSEVYKEEDREISDLPRTALVEEEVDINGKVIKTIDVAQNELLNYAMHNPYFLVRLKNSDNSNYPLTDEETTLESNKRMYEEVTAMDLIRNPRGASVFSPEDFLYVRNYDSLKLNRLITLRRFAHPCVDDIFVKRDGDSPDIARVLGFFDDEVNKLSDFSAFSFGLKWKHINSTSEKATMEGGGDGSGITGIAGTVMQLIDPKYGNEAMMGSARMNYDPQHDENRVYGPVDSIAEVHIRDVGVKFEQPMNLKFQFDLRSHNGINGKSAFIDLLSNLILLSTNDAKFWGGSRYWVGPRPSKYMNMLKKYDAKNWREWVDKASGGFKQLFNNMSKKENAKAMLQNIFNNAMNLALGRLLNVLGRTGIPVMNSLLSGSPVGLWHLTVGNPLNPIFVAGDLILDDSTIRFGDELGYDDFPTELELEVVIKHAKPKGRAEIENMFNCGKGRIYLKPKELKTLKGKYAKTKQDAITTGEYTNNKKMDKVGDMGNFNAEEIKQNYREVWTYLDDK